MRRLLYIFICIASPMMLMLTSCDKTLQATSMHITDSVRHYYPIVQGDELYITVDVTNVGSENLAITEIQPSNFAVVLTSPMPGIIPPGKTETLSFAFHSEKNLGLTEHSIRFFGNIYPDGVAELIFDTHIVRPTLDKSDYEEVFYEEKQSTIEELVDGERGQKGYWVGDQPEEF